MHELIFKKRREILYIDLIKLFVLFRIFLLEIVVSLERMIKL